MTDLRYSLEKHIDRLKDNEKAVIKGFFGIGLTSPKSLAEIGEEIGLTRERCRQLKEKGLRRLRIISRDSKLEQYL